MTGFVILMNGYRVVLNTKKSGLHPRVRRERGLLAPY